MSCVIFTRNYGRSTTKNHCQNAKNAGKSSKKASEGEETFPVGFLGRFAGCPKKSSKKKRGGYTVLDPDRQLVPARRHPKRKLKLIFQLPTIHLQVLFAFSFREGFFGVFQSFRRPNLSNQDAFAMHRKDATRNWWGKHVYCMPVSPQVAVSG